MKSTLFRHRWISASAIAIVVAGAATGGWAVDRVAPHLQQVAVIQTPAVDASQGFGKLVDAVKPAVVSVYVQAHGQISDNGPSGGQGGQGGGNDFQNLPDNSPLKRFFQQFGVTPPQQVQHYEAAGSGFAISADGYFVTNNHVVQNADKVTVVFDDGSQKTAKIVGTDPRTDLAVIKVDGLTDQPFVQLADQLPHVGDWVMAIGNPFGLGGTVTQGVVSAEGRNIGGSSYGDFLQIDAAVNRGNSGGPTFNLQGQVIGVNTEIYSPNGGSVGIAFDIPSTIVKQVTDQLMKNGKVTRGALGVSIQDLTPDLADSLGLKNSHGAVVAQLQPNSAASQAGLQAGDVIVSVDGQQITDALDLSRTIGGKPPGTKVDLTVVRNGQQQHVTATLGTLPEQQASNNSQQQPSTNSGPVQSTTGMTLVPNDNGPGVVVQDVDPNGAAAARGFSPGDVIVQVNRHPVSNGQDFEQAMNDVAHSGRHAALVEVQHNGNTRFVGLPIAQSGNGASDSNSSS